MDYPDLAAPDEAERPLGEPASSSLLSTLLCFGVRAAFVPDGLRLSVEPGVDTRWTGLITRDIVPLRIEIVVKPITELRLLFGSHNRLLTFDEQGALQDAAPWFLKVEAQKGVAHRGAGERRLFVAEWTRVTLEIDTRERRVFVNGELQHSWQGEFAGLRSRVGIGLRQSALSVRELNVESLEPP